MSDALENLKKMIETIGPFMPKLQPPVPPPRTDWYTRRPEVYPLGPPRRKTDAQTEGPKSAVARA